MFTSTNDVLLNLQHLDKITFVLYTYSKPFIAVFLLPVKRASLATLHCIRIWVCSSPPAISTQNLTCGCFNAEWRMIDSHSGGKSLRELEFNDLNMNFYLTLHYVMASYIVRLHILGIILYIIHELCV